MKPSRSLARTLGKVLLYPKLVLVRDLFKRVPVNRETPGLDWASRQTGYTSVPDGQEEFFYSVTVDWAGLEAMAHKAARSKGGKSADGPIAVRITGRRKLS